MSKVLKVNPLQVSLGSAAMLVAVAVTGQELEMAQLNDEPELQSASFSSSAMTVQLSFESTWAHLYSEVQAAVQSSLEEGKVVSLAAQQKALGIAAAIQVPTNLYPAVTDNEEGGIVFFWKGAHRECQLEIDSDGSHFLRLIGETGKVELEQESDGKIPVEHVSKFLGDWANERSRNPIGIQQTKFWPV